MKVLAIILAGGKRKELMPLVEDRCKAAIPFFGKYRVIDFVLSNCMNSGIRQVNVIAQHRFASLQKHLRDGWNVYSSMVGEYIDVYPPQQRYGESFYTGTADAVYQNLYSIENVNPGYVLILSGDHIYNMDYRKIVEYHINTQADLTIASIPIASDYAKYFGIMDIDKNNQVIRFEEKPDAVKKDNEDSCWASMGLYVFSTKVLMEIFHGHQTGHKSLDFGRDIVPTLISNKKVFAYPFVNEVGESKYWNFLGSLKEYYDGNMSILSNKNSINLYDAAWPYRTFQSQSPPTRSLSGNRGKNLISNSAISSGGLIEGQVTHSIVGTNVTVEQGAEISDSILFDGVTVKNGAKVENAIIDKEITIPEKYILNGKTYCGDMNHAVKTKDIVVLGKKVIL